LPSRRPGSKEKVRPDEAASPTHRAGAVGANLRAGAVHLAGPEEGRGGHSPILLTDPVTLSPETQTWLVTNASSYQQVVAFGLAGAVSNQALAAANAAIGH